jgi:hypothetical protein
MSWMQDLLKLAADKVLVKEQVEQDVADMRWQTCWPCENMDHENKTCKICGCFIELKIWAKVSRSPQRPMGEITHCPIGKWQDKDIANHYRELDGKPPLE